MVLSLRPQLNIFIFILVTLSGMVMLVRFSHSSKAPAAMVFVPLFIMQEPEWEDLTVIK